MPALDRNEKLACTNYGTKVSKNNLTRHKKRFSAGTLYCSQCPNFSAMSRNDLNYNIRHGAPKPKIAHTCKVCKEEFTGFYALRQHKSKVHGQSFKTSGNSTPLLDAIDDDNLKEERLACQHFLLVRNLRNNVREFSILHWILLVLKKSTQSWIMFCYLFDYS